MVIESESVEDEDEPELELDEPDTVTAQKKKKGKEKKVKPGVLFREEVCLMRDVNDAVSLGIGSYGVDNGDRLRRQIPWGENVMTRAVPTVPPATERWINIIARGQEP